MQYDVAIIGSSPVCIAESIHQSSLGKKVVLIESGDFGGSWKCKSVFNFKYLEIGPHVFSGTDTGYKSLKLFGCKLRRAHICFFDLHQKKLYTWDLQASKHWEKAQSWWNKIFDDKINFLKFTYNILKIVQITALPKKERIYYLKAGCYELLNQLTSNEYWGNVELLKKKCTEIHHIDDLIKIDLSLGESIFAQQVFLTGGSTLDLEKIYSTFPHSHKKKSIKKRIFSADQVSLLLKNNTKKIPFSNFILDNSEYVGSNNFLVKKNIKYTSDITSYVEAANSLSLSSRGISVFSASIDPTCYKTKNEKLDTKKLLQDLKNMTLISNDSILIDYHIENAPGSSYAEEDINFFNDALGGKVNVLSSASLVSSFEKNYPRWKNLKRMQK